ncbi:unnamed protein product [Triticum turgidum subsp. durum]|uniref:Fucosyltransferase n=1 Tax=Triticum turgidum subsp. durum TaxID=4567 RepID=A0A9R0ZUI9_TRITD|nr:unnamed protein product [Triticum turgidum subsp. durum]
MKTRPAAEGKRWCPGIDTKLVAFLLTVPSLIVFLGGRNGEQPAVEIEAAMPGRGPDVASFLQRKTAPNDRLLGGLLADGFDQKSCHSRYQSAVYRRNAGRQPSQHLVSKLRSHEALQRRCGPGTAAYTNALEQLKSGKSVAYIHLDYNQTDHDKLFFCDDDQRVLRDIQWLVMRTDSYIVPGLFLVKAFEEELDALFPERDAVFHHLGRYLFHPTNQVWGLIARYYRAHLASARRVVGIQVRVFPWEAESPEILEQIKTCTQNERLLPAVLDEEDDDEPAVVTGAQQPTAVLVTSLKAWYSDKMKEMYWERATADGRVVVVDQPSHEETQRYDVRSHEHKAWAEVYLLSVTDMLVTTGQSTFGYVAQGLGGLKPWVLHHVTNGTVGWPCSRDVSMEPCFHVPPLYDCKRREDAGLIVPHVRHCGDLPAGLKLVDRREW